MRGEASTYWKALATVAVVGALGNAVVANVFVAAMNPQNWGERTLPALGWALGAHGTDHSLRACEHRLAPPRGAILALAAGSARLRGTRDRVGDHRTRHRRLALPSVRPSTEWDRVLNVRHVVELSRSSRIEPA